nr:PEP/pyruvate-binding domain-containing protein [Cyclobacterium marinum]
MLSTLDTSDFSNLQEVGEKCRQLMLSRSFHKELEEIIKEGHDYLTGKYGEGVSFAARSSATAEDLPNASFAGQQETYLNVTGIDNLLKACHRCYASLFTDRAIKYRTDNGLEYIKVALSVGVQLMVRSDMACSGVTFSLDPDTGFEKVALIAGAWAPFVWKKRSVKGSQLRNL